MERLPSRPLPLSLTLMAGTIAAGLVIRFVHLGLPAGVVKYGGSMLWALMIYWIVSALLPSRRCFPDILLSGSLATAMELLKLYRSPGLDAFRRTLPGILLLGRFFSVQDILAYWLAILAGCLLDRAIRRRRVSR